MLGSSDTSGNAGCSSGVLCQRTKGASATGVSPLRAPGVLGAPGSLTSSSPATRVHPVVGHQRLVGDVGERVEKGQRRAGEAGDLGGRGQVGHGLSHLTFDLLVEGAQLVPDSAELARHLGQLVRAQQDQGQDQHHQQLGRAERQHVPTLYRRSPGPSGRGALLSGPVAPARSEAGDETLDAVVVGAERVFQEHGALGLVVQLEVHPVNGEVPAALLGPPHEGTAQAGPGCLGGWVIARAMSASVQVRSICSRRCNL